MRCFWIKNFLYPQNVDDELENLVRSGSVGGLLSTDFRAVLENSIAGPPMVCQFIKLKTLYPLHDWFVSLLS